MAGILYGVGIGPGDPELLTLKAKKILEDVDILIFPGEIAKDTIAYQIIKNTIDFSGKELVGIAFPMTKDPKILEENHKKGAEKIAELLESGKNAAFPTLGDPSVYSTFSYVNKILKKMGYQTEVIPGIPSFCAASAKLGEALGETSQQIHIIPSSYGIQEAIHLPGTKVLMKAGKKIGQVIQEAAATGQKMTMLENLGMENERIIENPDKSIDAGYYTLVIMKES